MYTAGNQGSNYHTHTHTHSTHIHTSPPALFHLLVCTLQPKFTRTHTYIQHTPDVSYAFLLIRSGGCIKSCRFTAACRGEGDSYTHIHTNHSVLLRMHARAELTTTHTHVTHVHIQDKDMTHTLTHITTGQYI